MQGQPSPIRQYLDEHGIKYAHFCKRLGITPVDFTRIEAGTKRPPADYYERAALFLDVDVERIRPMEVPA